MLRVRWLGRVPYEEAYALQVALHDRGTDDHLLMLEHPHVFTLGAHADPAHILVDPLAVGASAVRTDRGGGVTYHGPGQLVAYPIVAVPTGPSSIANHVDTIEQIVIDALGDLGLSAGRLAGYPGVWVDCDGPSPRKICSIGIRVGRQRSMHGLALNVHPDLEWFGRIVPCGIPDKAVTSLAAEGVDVTMADAVDAVARRASARWAPQGDVERQDVAVRSRSLIPVAGRHLTARLRQAGVDPDAGVALRSRKPSWLRAPAHMGNDFLALGATVRHLGLVTVCEEAGCPNIFECWADGTATFMINGDRCTRACGFCLVDTRHPLPADPDEPERVAQAVEQLGLAHAVVTAVARDDLGDGGAAGFVATIAAIKRRCPDTAVEVLIPDCKGDERSLGLIFDARPDILNHNIETVARLHRAVRPSASYARTLTVLARAKGAGLTTKSGLMVGLGESAAEVEGALADLRAVGTDIVTIGQYLRPSAAHLPVQRWWEPTEFDSLRAVAQAMGFAHVEASPLTRSSYHARQAAAHTVGTDADAVGATSGVSAR